MSITFTHDHSTLDWDALANLFLKAGLGQPAAADLRRAYQQSALTIFAYAEATLVGAARALSDGVYHAEICDTVVLPAFQRQGIGQSLVRALLEELTGQKVLLTAAFGKEGFYQELGFRRHKTALAYGYGPWWYVEGSA